MKSMEIYRFAQKAVAAFLVVMLTGTYSVFAAAAATPIGEIIVVGTAAADAPAVTVNGEPVKSGRTLFSASTVVTTESLSATLNLGRAGRLQLSENSSFVLRVEGDRVSGELLAGRLTVLSTARKVDVKLLTGEITSLGAGESVANGAVVIADDKDANGRCRDTNGNGRLECDCLAGRAATEDYIDLTGTCIDNDKDGKLECTCPNDDDDDDKYDGLDDWWLWAIVGGAAAAVVIIAVVASDDDDRPVVSPVR